MTVSANSEMDTTCRYQLPARHMPSQPFEKIHLGVFQLLVLSSRRIWQKHTQIMDNGIKKYVKFLLQAFFGHFYCFLCLLLLLQISYPKTPLPSSIRSTTLDALYYIVHLIHWILQLQIFVITIDARHLFICSFVNTILFLVKYLFKTF